MPDRDLALLVGAAEAAAEVALSHFGRAPQSWDKPDATPVTEADIAVDTLLREILTGARPDHGWLSEETPDTPARLAARRAFVVDPIDGTRAFIAGEADWCHSIALVEDGVPVAAVVLQPVHGRLYTALRGQGARMDGASLPSPDSGAAADPPRILTAKSSLDPRRWPGGLPTLAPGFRPSLAFRMALVAEGRVEAMLSLRPTWEWDIAAGALIVAEAGLRATDATGAPLRFNAATPRTDGVLAAGPSLHARLVAGLTGQPAR